MMTTLILVLHVLAAVLLVGLVLIQQGQGADAGAAFGSGASQTVFGAQGAGSFLTRATTALAILFFATSLTLAYFSNRGADTLSVVEKVSERSAGSERPPLDGEQGQAGGPPTDAPRDPARFPEIPD